jgi:hypothetical protein
MKMLKFISGFVLVKKEQIDGLRKENDKLLNDIHTLIVEPNSDKTRILSLLYATDYKITNIGLFGFSHDGNKPIGIVNQIGLKPKAVTAQITLSPDAVNILNKIDLNNLSAEGAE